MIRFSYHHQKLVTENMYMCKHSLNKTIYPSQYLFRCYSEEQRTKKILLRVKWGPEDRLYMYSRITCRKTPIHSLLLLILTPGNNNTVFITFVQNGCVSQPGVL